MIIKKIIADVDSFFARDPAARNRLEVIFCYPGLHAVVFYRVNHWLWQHNLKFIARFLSYIARIITGIEIHPAARIGERLFIDHGFGVVIGETATIGNDVTIYHDVTLGGTSWNAGIRHPQVGNNVIIGAGAQLLGPLSIGDNSRIGSNAVVINDVAPDTTVVGVPARPLHEKIDLSADKYKHFEAYATPHDTQSDPTLSTLAEMAQELNALKARIVELETQQSGIERTAERWEKKE